MTKLSVRMLVLARVIVWVRVTRSIGMRVRMLVLVVFVFVVVVRMPVLVGVLDAVRVTVFVGVFARIHRCVPSSYRCERSNFGPRTRAPRRSLADARWPLGRLGLWMRGGFGQREAVGPQPTQ